MYKTPLTNTELKEVGYKESIFNDYMFKFYTKTDAIIVDMKSREVTFYYNVPKEFLEEIKIQEKNN
jgi:hypothetical protein